MFTGHFLLVCGSCDICDFPPIRLCNFVQFILQQRFFLCVARVAAVLSMPATVNWWPDVN